MSGTLGAIGQSFGLVSLQEFWDFLPCLSDRQCLWKSFLFLSWDGREAKISARTPRRLTACLKVRDEHRMKMPWTDCFMFKCDFKLWTAVDHRWCVAACWWGWYMMIYVDICWYMMMFWWYEMTWEDIWRSVTIGDDVATLTLTLHLAVNHAW